MAQDRIIKTRLVKDALLIDVNDDIAELYTITDSTEADVVANTAEIVSARDGELTLLTKQELQDTIITGKAAANHTHGPGGTVAFSTGTNVERLAYTPTADMLWYEYDNEAFYFYDFSGLNWNMFDVVTTLSGLTDVSTATPTNNNTLIADGTNWSASSKIVDRINNENTNLVIEAFRRIDSITKEEYKNGWVDSLQGETSINTGDSKNYQYNSNDDYYFNTVSDPTCGGQYTYHAGNINTGIGVCELDTDKVLITYVETGSDGFAKVASVSNNVVTFGEPVAFEAGTASYIDCCKLDTDKFAVSWKDVSDSQGNVIIGTVSGTVITFGTECKFIDNNTSYTSICKIDDDKIAVAFNNAGDDQDLYTIIGTVSGTHITYDEKYKAETAVTTYNSIEEIDTNKFMLNYNIGKSVIGTVTNDGLTVSTPVEYRTGTLQGTSTCFDSNSNKVVITYIDNGVGKVVIGAVSSDDYTITFESSVTFHADTIQYISSCFDSTTNKVVIAYCDTVDAGKGKTVVGTVSGTNITFGSEDEFEDGLTTHTSMCFDSTTNKVVIAYCDTVDAGKGKTVVGTVSGTNMNFGSPDEFDTGTVGGTTTVYDSNSDKIVVIYKEDLSSSGRAKVGTVSGDSISFGAVNQFETETITHLASAFDSNSNKVVILYYIDGSVGSGRVGTVSANSISFGDAADIGYYYNAISFDSSNNKLIASYLVSDTAEAVVCSVDGTTLVPENETKITFESNNGFHQSSCYDSNNKVVIGTYSDSDYDGRAVVMRTPTERITYGTKTSLFETGTGSYNSTVKLETDKCLILWRNSSSYVECVVADVSGSDITIGDSIEIGTVCSVVGYHNLGCLIDTNKVLVSLNLSTVGNRVAIVNIDGTDLYADSIYTIYDDATEYGTSQELCKLDTGKAIAVYEQSVAAGYGKCIAIDWSNPIPEDMVLLTNSYTALDNVVESKAIVIKEDVVDNVVMNTDFKVYGSIGEKDVTNATVTNPVVITAADHGISNDDTVSIAEVVWYRSNGDKINNNCNSFLINWAETGDGTTTAVTYDSVSCWKFDSGTSGNHTVMSKDIGSIDYTYVFSIKLYHEDLGTVGDTNYFEIKIDSTNGGLHQLLVKMGTDGLFVYDGSTDNEVGTNIVQEGAWQEWVFVVDNSTAGSEIVDVYLDGVVQGTGLDCSYSSGTDGYIYLKQNGTTNANQITYCDWFILGTDFGYSDMNGTVYIASNVTTNTLELTGLDGSDYSLYKTDGKLNFVEQITMSDVCSFTTVQDIISGKKDMINKDDTATKLIITSANNKRVRIYGLSNFIETS